MHGLMRAPNTYLKARFPPKNLSLMRINSVFCRQLLRLLMGFQVCLPESSMPSSTPPVRKVRIVFDTDQRQLFCNIKGWTWVRTLFSLLLLRRSPRHLSIDPRFCRQKSSLMCPAYSDIQLRIRFHRPPAHYHRQRQAHAVWLQLFLGLSKFSTSAVICLPFSKIDLLERSRCWNGVPCFTLIFPSMMSWLAPTSIWRRIT